MEQQTIKHYYEHEECYRILIEGPITQLEFKKKLKDLYGMSDNTARTIAKKSIESEMIYLKDDKYYLDIKLFDAFLRDLYRSYGFTQLTKQEIEVEQEVTDEDGEPENLEELVKVLNKECDDYLEQLTKLQCEHDNLKKDYEELKADYIDALENEHVIVQESVCVADETIAPDDLFMTRPYTYREEDRDFIEEQNAWNRESFFKEIRTDENEDDLRELSIDNDRRKTFKHICTKDFLKEIVFCVDEMDRLLQAGVDEGDIDKILEIRKKYVALSIAINDKLTNKEKMALYAQNGRYANTEIGNLLTYAADYCMNADFLIGVLEKIEDKNDLIGMRDMIRQMMSPSQAKNKLEFARELINGDWYVMADYNGKPTKFQLMPVEELNRLKRIVLGDSEESDSEKGDDSDE